MVFRRTNWPVVLAIGILGPMLGLLVGAGYVSHLTGWFAGADKPSHAERSSSNGLPKSEPSTPDQKVVLPDGDRLGLDRLAPERAAAIVVMKSPWCPVCQRQLRALSERMSQLQQVDGAVFGLTTAGPHQNRKLQHKLGLGFPVLGDPSRALHQKLDLWLEKQGHAMPGIIFLNEDGGVAKIHRGRYPGERQERSILRELRRISGSD